MKALVLSVLVLGLCLPALAKEATAQEGYGITPPLTVAVKNPRAIYDALNVTETSGSSFEAWWREKSVGGLVCRKARYGYPTAPVVYTCDLRTALKNNEAIYNALNVKPVALNPGIAGVGRGVKKVGGIACLREQLIVLGASPTFTCQTK